MPSFDPPSSVSKFEYVVRRVYLHAQHMSDGCDLARSEAINHFSAASYRELELT